LAASPCHPRTLFSTHSLVLTLFRLSTYPLFPYTTLFRSLFLDIKMKGLNGIDTATQLRKISPHIVIIFITAYPDFVFQGYEVRADRKSTRLNSSHGSISYAVFSLKKKEK